MTVYNLIKVLTTCPSDLKVYDEFLHEITCICKRRDDYNREIVVLNDSDS